MADDPTTLDPKGPHMVEPTAPDMVAPDAEHLGLVCVDCGKPFSLIGPLDPTLAPPDRPLNIRAKSPVLHAVCNHCGHKADYPIEQLHRLSLS